jgi:hypothetical protein
MSFTDDLYESYMTHAGADHYYDSINQTKKNDSKCIYCGVNEFDLEDLGLRWAKDRVCSWCYDELGLDSDKQPVNEPSNEPIGYEVIVNNETGSIKTEPWYGNDDQYVLDTDNNVWLVVRDGGMVTRATDEGQISGGIEWLEINRGPLIWFSAADIRKKFNG